MTASIHDKDLEDGLYYYIWFEFLMNYDKLGVRDAYQKQKEKNKNKVDSETLRDLGYSEEDIQKANL